MPIRRHWLLAVILIAASSIPVHAVVPDSISFQGRLADTAGVLLNGTYNITLRLYDAPSAGSLLWTEAHANVSVVNGIHNLYMGSVTSLAGLAFDRPYWVSIELNGGGEMTPRRPVTTAPYAFRAKYADTAAYADTAGYAAVAATSVGGVTDTDWVIAGDTIYRLTGRVGIGTATPTDSLTVAGTMSVDSPTLVVDAANNRVGVGTSSPGYPLDVGGNIHASGVYIDTNFQIGPGGGYGGMYFNRTNGHLGLGDVATQALTIGWNGKIGFTGNAPVMLCNDKYLYAPASGLLEWRTNAAAAAHAFAVSDAGVRKVYLDVAGNSYLTGGNVGIGTDTPAYPLTMGSGAHVTVGGVWTNASSREYKHDIVNLSAADCADLLARLDAIDVVRYRYNAETTGEEHLGVIAEDAPEELVTPDRHGVPTGDAIGYLLAVVKALREQNTQLKIRIEALEQR